MNSTNDTGVGARPATEQARRTHGLRGLVGAGFAATLAAMLATTPPPPPPSSCSTSSPRR